MIMAADPNSQTITITPLFSGSSGNAILVSSADALVLVDAGMNCKKIVEALNIVRINPFDLSAPKTHPYVPHIHQWTKKFGLLKRGKIKEFL